MGGRREARRLSRPEAAHTAAEALAAVLAEAGVTHAFTVAGESFLGLLDALHDLPIRVVATRHEAGAGFMAEALGQLTGRPAACLVTRAVGTANLSIALHTARQNSTPLIAICGQVETRFRGREAFQEADLTATFGALCKAAAEVTEPGRVASTARALFAEASSGRPGPVLLSAPEDVLEAPAAPSFGGGPPAPTTPGPDDHVPRTTLALDRSAVVQALRLLCTARRPIIVAGAGITRSSAGAKLVAFAEETVIPVIAAWRRPDVFPNEKGLYLGMAGLGSARTVRARLEEADAILAIGTRLSEITTYGYAVPGPDAALIHVDVDPTLPGRPPAKVAIRADARAFLEAALAALASGDVAEALERADERQSSAAGDRAKLLVETRLPASRDGDAVDPAAIIRALREQLPEGSVITTDAGNFAGWAARYLPVPPSGRFIGPTSGAMGYALPAAIAAAIAEPDRTVVALAGDGGFAMLMAELETAVREGARLTAVVFDNQMYGTIRMHQEETFPGRVVATDLGPIDFAAVARACGANGVTAQRNEDVPGAIRRALESAGVSVVHVKVDRRYLSVDRLLD